MYEQRRPRPRPPEPSRPLPAALALLAAERDALPFGIVAEFLGAGAEQPPAAPEPAFQIAEWTEEERRRENSVVVEREPQPPTVLDVMEFDRDEPPPLGPPVTYAPLQRYLPPEPDWRAEEQEIAALEAAELAGQAQAELEPVEPTRPTYPPARRPRRWRWP
jgi:hypothetical protein